jgi:hypothetical protein
LGKWQVGLDGKPRRKGHECAVSWRALQNQTSSVPSRVLLSHLISLSILKGCSDLSSGSRRAARSLPEAGDAGMVCPARRERDTLMVRSYPAFAKASEREVGSMPGGEEKGVHSAGSQAPVVSLCLPGSDHGGRGCRGFHRRLLPCEEE